MPKVIIEIDLSGKNKSHSADTNPRTGANGKKQTMAARCLLPLAPNKTTHQTAMLFQCIGAGQTGLINVNMLVIFTPCWDQANI